MPTTEIERDLTRLEADLKRLEAEYNMFFSGRLPKPPWTTRNRVEALVKQCDRAHIPNFGDRFRFTTLQARYAAFIDLWDRGLRAREEGRAGPFVHQAAAHSDPPQRAEDRVLFVTALRDPTLEPEKLQDLYQSVAAARREVGADNVPFHRFAELVKTQVEKMKAAGSPEIAFRVEVRDGNVHVAARGVRGGTEE